MKEDKKRQLIKIAKYYYNDGLTQEEIASKMFLSRQKVGRLMQKLIPEGIIEILIDDSLDNYLNLERELEEKFNLKEVVVITTQDTNHLTLDMLGKAGAQYLDRVVKPNNVIGIAWGRTMAYVSQHIVRERRNLNLSVVQLAGGVFPYDHFFEGELRRQLARQSGEITRDISVKLGAKPYLMNMPLIVDDAATKEKIVKNSTVNSVFEKAGKCDMIMISIASLGKSVTPFREGVLDDGDLKYLLDKRAVGNFLFNYFDIEGKSIEAPFSHRLMCPELDVMRKIPIKICVSGTREKINPIYGGIKSGLVDVLITDYNTAISLMKK